MENVVSPSFLFHFKRWVRRKSFLYSIVHTFREISENLYAFHFSFVFPYETLFFSNSDYVCVLQQNSEKAYRVRENGLEIVQGVTQLRCLSCDTKLKTAFCLWNLKITWAYVQPGAVWNLNPYRPCTWPQTENTQDQEKLVFIFVKGMWRGLAQCLCLCHWSLCLGPALGSAPVSQHPRSVTQVLWDTAGQVGSEQSER